MTDIPPRIERFTSFQDITARPAYVPRLDLGDGCGISALGLIEIEGDRPLWAACGLDGCNQAHKHGFLIRNAAGAETACGGDCAERHLGLRWKEIEATFARALDLQDRVDYASRLRDQFSAFAAEARDVGARVAVAQRQLQQALAELQQHRDFLRQVKNCAKQSGDILISGGPGAGRVRAGTLRAASLLVDDLPDHDGLVNRSVLPWCEKVLAFEQQPDLSARAVDEFLARAKEHQETVRRATVFLRDAELLFAPGNLAQLELIRQHLLPEGAWVQHWLPDSLSHLAAMTSEHFRAPSD